MENIPFQGQSSPHGLTGSWSLFVEQARNGANIPPFLGYFDISRHTLSFSSWEQPHTAAGNSVYVSVLPGGAETIFSTVVPKRLIAGAMKKRSYQLLHSLADQINSSRACRMSKTASA